MKIVLTDASTMNPGDLSWEHWNALGDITIYEHTSSHQLKNRIADADIVVVNKTPLTEDVLEYCHNLQLICVSATGYNNVAVRAFAQKNIPVCNAADYSAESVVQHVFAYMFHHLNSIEKYTKEVRLGRWSDHRDFTFYDKPILELSSLTLGIIGFGSLGKSLALKASLWGMKVLVSSHPSRKLESQYGVEVVSLLQMLKESDFVSLHVPLTEKTAGLVNRDLLRSMKKSSVLINTARGPIVDSKALFATLEQKEISAAYLDVMDQEPPPRSPLFTLENCFITPHQAWASKQARERLMEIVIANIESFQNGSLKNRVN